MNLTAMLEKANKEKKIKDALIEKHLAFQNELKEHPSRQFALMLASVLGSQSSITDVQSSLFQAILDAFKLGDIRGCMFEESRNISPDVLVEALSVITEFNLEHLLLLDSLVLLLSAGKLSNEAEKLIGELADAMGIEAMALSKINNEAKAILEAGEPERKDILKNIRPGTRSRELTAAALSEGISGGLWHLDNDLEVNFPWQANDAIFAFEQGVCLATNTHGNFSGEMKITNCKFVNASLVFLTENCDETVSIDQCEWQGNYLRKDLAAALTVKKGKLSVRNSKFTTYQACAIQGDPLEKYLQYPDGREETFEEYTVEVENCEFIDCGHIDKLGGAIIIYEPLNHDCSNAKIINSKFTNCKGKHAGALFASQLGNLILTNCEFVSCKSSKIEKKESDALNFIAVFVAKSNISYNHVEIRSSKISNCRFQHTSFRIKECGEYDGWFIKDSNFQNAFVFLPDNIKETERDHKRFGMHPLERAFLIGQGFHIDHNEYNKEATLNCIFEKGRVIKLTN